MQIQYFKCSYFNEIPSKYWFLARLVFFIGAILLCGKLDAPAQNLKQSKRKSANKVSAQNVQPKKVEKSNADPINNNPVLPINVVNSAETDYLSGEASVVVNPKQPTVVRLGLAQNAVSIVEFPASDGVYYIHEGNPKLVSVFQSPTKDSDRSITIYPGEGFVAGLQNASATITLQMRSGLILILEFVPVSRISNNAHRCVINYDRDEVISARRSAGLAYNLGENNMPALPRNTRANSKLVSSNVENTPEKLEENTKQAEIIPVNLSQTEVTKGNLSRLASENSKQTPKTGLELSRLVNRRLADCLKNPAKSLGGWSPENNGLSLAVTSVTEIDSTQKLVIVAVRNNWLSSLRLVPGTPELQIVTVDDKSNPIQTERLERNYVETTSFDGFISPGSTVYYALVYNAPVMGASQRLTVLVSHREAADSPTTTILPGANLNKEQ